MIWDLVLAKKIADFEYTHLIDLDSVADTSEGVTLSGAMDAYLRAVKAEFPAAESMNRVGLETNATRHHTFNKVSVVIRWAYRSVKNVYIPSEEKLFVPGFPVGPSARTFRLPQQPDINDMFRSYRNEAVPVGYKTYTIRGFDDVRQAWVYEAEGVPVQVSGENFIAGKYPRVKIRSGRTTIENRELSKMDIYKSVKNNLMSPDEVRRELGLSPKKRALKDMPVRESGLGIW